MSKITRIFILISLLFGGLTLTGCNENGLSGLSNTLVTWAINDEQEARLFAAHDAMLSRDAEALREIAHEDLLNERFDAGLAEMLSVIPDGDYESRRAVSYNWRQSTNANGTIRREQYVHIYTYSSGRMTVTTNFLSRGDDPIALNGLHVNFVAFEDTPQLPWTFAHTFAVTLALSVAFFALISAIAVFRVKRLKRRILWFVFIALVGYPTFTFFSHTGSWIMSSPGFVSSGNSWNINFISVKLLSAAWMTFPLENRWTIDVSLPLGAILFWLQFFRDSLVRKPLQNGETITASSSEAEDDSDKPDDSRH